MAPKTEAENLELLLMIIDHAGQIDWEEVAKAHPVYKKGKYAKQAYNNLKKKFELGNTEAPPATVTAAASDSKATVKSTAKATPKKRTNKAQNGGSASKKLKSEKDLEGSGGEQDVDADSSKEETV